MEHKNPSWTTRFAKRNTEPQAHKDSQILLPSATYKVILHTVMWYIFHIDLFDMSSKTTHILRSLRMLLQIEICRFLSHN